MKHALKHVDPKLISNAKPFMYTEFPHKRYWSSSFGDAEYRTAIRSMPVNTPAMLYVHIPYCEQLCLYCTCHIEITSNYAKAQKYLTPLLQEIALLRQIFQEYGNTPDFHEIHLGGGSPTFLREPEFDSLMDAMHTLVPIKNLDEFSIEIDPRRVDRERLRYYAAHGINRISFGVQDFHPDVQRAINRIQPPELVENLIVPEIRELFCNGINFDLICGLPNQTVKTISDTCRRTLEMGPDRICLNYLHLIEEHRPYQSIMHDGKNGRPTQLPDEYMRKELFLAAMDILLAGGYVRMGYDHFAKPSDRIARAMREQKITWNALGVTPGRYLDSIGIGVSSISEVNGCYFQNHYNEIDYRASLAGGKLPILRGHCLTYDDIVRREIIQKIRTYFYLHFQEIENKYNLDFARYFHSEIQKLSPFIADDLVKISDKGIFITESGQQYANVVCSCFDSYYVS